MYRFCCIEDLIIKNVLGVGEVVSLPFGHALEDIEQASSCTTEWLRSNDSITLQDLHHQLSKVYNHGTEVLGMEAIIHLSGLCEQERCTKKINYFTHNRYFGGTAVDPCSHNRSTESTRRQVKVNHSDKRISLFRNLYSESFLSTVTDSWQPPRTQPKTWTK